MAERSPTEGDIVDRHLRRAWQAVAPAPGLQEQVRARLTSSTAATMGAAAMGMASRARPVGGWASLQASGTLGALVGAGLLGVGLLAGYVLGDSREDTQAPVAAVARINEVSTPVAPPRAELVAGRGEALSPSDVSKTSPHEPISPTPTPLPSRSVRSPVSKAPSGSRGLPSAAIEATRPSDELSLLRRADRAVRADNAALALALIGELEARYPASMLLEERHAIELLAYCGVGATDATARAQRFLHEYPSSAYAGRIRKMCRAMSNLSPLPPR
jgi:hypothetical protein